MNLTIFLLITIFWCVAFFYSIYHEIFPISRSCAGRNHCGIVDWHSSGGDIHFNDMSSDEIIDRLRFDYFMFRDNDRSCANALNESHLAEYRILTTCGRVKTIGYITKDKVVFEGKTYYFPGERY